MTDKRRPVHLAVLVGMSASAYAISLAGVAALQSATDAQVAADRAPAGAAADALASGHDQLERSLDEASRAYVVSSERYARVGTGLVDMETSLDALGTRVEKVTGAAKALPGRVSLPTISSSARVITRTRVVHATTGASG
jgi:hypothetical protein